MAVVAPFSSALQRKFDKILAEEGVDLKKSRNPDHHHPVLSSIPYVRAVNFFGQEIDLVSYINKIR